MSDRVGTRAGFSSKDEALPRAQRQSHSRTAAVAATRLIATCGISAGVAATGGAASPLVPLAVAIAAACGVTGGIVTGATAGVIVATGSIPALAAEAGAGVPINHLAAWAMLFPLSGTVAGLIHRLRSQPTPASERRRIARDLHDGVAQTLAHLRLELDMLSHPELARTTDPEGLARLARVADRTLTDVRALINDLAAPLPDGGLVAALRAHIRDMQSGHGPLVELDATGPTDAPPATESHIYRITQEALSNAVRHSGASIVRVVVRGERGGGIHVTIEDNGCGMHPGARRDGGLGLDTMQERARAIGASLSIDSDAQGTRVSVRSVASLSRSA